METMDKMPKLCLMAIPDEPTTKDTATLKDW